MTYKNVKIIPGAEIAPIVAALGQPQNYMESPSCAFTGLDKIYTYPHFMIYSYPMNNVDYVYMVTLTDDIVSTDEGVKIGIDISSAVTATEITIRKSSEHTILQRARARSGLKPKTTLSRILPTPQ